MKVVDLQVEEINREIKRKIKMEWIFSKRPNDLRFSYLLVGEEERSWIVWFGSREKERAFA